MSRRKAAEATDSGAPGHPEDDPGDPESVARAICLRLLTFRARSRGELEDALRQREVPDDAAAHVLDRLTAVGLIDDVAFARQMVEVRHRERGLAARALERDLIRRKLDPDLVRDAVSAVDRDAERERAAQLVRARLQRMDNIAEPARTRRLVSLLARKGYSPSLAFEIVSRESAAARDGADADASHA